MKHLISGLVALTTIGVSSSLLAQTYPVKPIKFIVAFTAGSGTDIVGRAVADNLSKSIGQPVIVENRPGAGGTIAANLVTKAEPDGYTVLLHSSAHTVNPAIYPSLPYDPKDLTGVTGLASSTNVLVVNSNKGWKSMTDLLNAVKAAPDKFNYASAGVGSATHLNGEKFLLRAGLQVNHIPYKGTPEVVASLLSGSNDWYFSPISAAMPFIKDGRLTALAVSGTTRSSALPNVPTTNEAGVPNSDYALWFGMWVHAATPPAVLKKLHEETIKALNSADVKERLSRLGSDPMPMESAAFNNFVRGEMEVSAAIAKAANLKAQ